mmetsp:Transcript_877/g.2367  ORF Transcript_877/g.2367 Transcript_877/m.2367 type:complete len:421 (+) Transcript_877:945-2207(+)
MVGVDGRLEVAGAVQVVALALEPRGVHLADVAGVLAEALAHGRMVLEVKAVLVHPFVLLAALRLAQRRREHARRVADLHAPRRRARRRHERELVFRVLLLFVLGGRRGRRGRRQGPRCRVSRLHLSRREQLRHHVVVVDVVDEVHVRTKLAHVELLHPRLRRAGSGQRGAELRGQRPAALLLVRPAHAALPLAALALPLRLLLLLFLLGLGLGALLGLDAVKGGIHVVLGAALLVLLDPLDLLALRLLDAHHLAQRRALVRNAPALHRLRQRRVALALSLQRRLAARLRGRLVAAVIKGEPTPAPRRRLGQLHAQHTAPRRRAAARVVHGAMEVQGEEVRREVHLEEAVCGVDVGGGGLGAAQRHRHHHLRVRLGPLVARRERHGGRGLRRMASRLAWARSPGAAARCCCAGLRLQGRVG